MLTYVGRIHNLKDLKNVPLGVAWFPSLACSGRVCELINKPFPRKDAGLCCGSRLREGEVFSYVGRNQNLKDLKDLM